jgi:hypothetical protein
VRRNGKPARSWVYAIADRIQTGRDFRLFQPAQSDEEGKFTIAGLAPGTYLIFASDVELAINLHDPAEVNYWRSRAKDIRVEAGKAVQVDLPSLDPPDEPY